MRIGLLHPGEMGAAFGAALRTRGHDVLWLPEGRSGATRDRAHPVKGPTATLYLSGGEADVVAQLFAGTYVQASVISDRVGPASALKMVYAGWTKGSAALLLAVQQAATAAGVDAELLAEWHRSEPELPEQLAWAQRSAMKKGWRRVGEMEEIAEFFASVGEPEGFHRAAADIHRKFPR
jgi:hypothetical protein